MKKKFNVLIFQGTFEKLQPLKGSHSIITDTFTKLSSHLKCSASGQEQFINAHGIVLKSQRNQFFTESMRMLDFQQDSKFLVIQEIKEQWSPEQRWYRREDQRFIGLPYFLAAFLISVHGSIKSEAILNHQPVCSCSICR